jgi:hypothetical protein
MTDAEGRGMQIGMQSWLDDRLAELPGKNKTGLARAIGSTPPRISEIIAGDRRVQEHEWAPMAEYLEWTLQRLHQAVEGTAADDHTLVQQEDMPKLSIDLPRWLSESLSGGEFKITPEQQELVERPSRLKSSVNAFAFWIFGSELTPAFEAGDTVFIDPTRPVKPNDDCLFAKGYTQGSKEPFYGVVRRLVREEPDSWIVRLYEDRDEITLPKSEYKHALCVAGKWSR